MFDPARRMSYFQEHFFASLNARLAALRSEGAGIIRLDEGAPDLPPAPHIIETLARAAGRPDAHATSRRRFCGAAPGLGVYFGCTASRWTRSSRCCRCSARKKASHIYRWLWSIQVKW
jgi:hypothetical protein